MKKAHVNWIKQKSLGRRKYVLIYGVGLYMCASLVYSILTIFFNPRFQSYTLEGIIARFIVYAMMFGLGWLIYGNINWHYKSKYLR